MSAEHAGGPPAHVLGRLARVADRVAAAFDGPHDLEWVVGTDERVQLLRVRPVVRLHVTPVTGGSETMPETEPAPVLELVGSAA